MLNRIWLNLTTTRWKLRRTFPDRVLDDIQAAIAQAETRHSGELRFAIETAMDLPALISGVTARDRAIAAFSDLMVWDTRANNGVLIYLLLAERDIEIVADRGYTGRVHDREWRAICAAMEAEFRRGEYAAGALLGIESVSALVARYFPPAPDDTDELENRPALL